MLDNRMTYPRAETRLVRLPVWVMILVALCLWLHIVSYSQAQQLKVEVGQLKKTLELAQSGDILLLAPGVYQGSFHITASLTLIGQPGVIIDAGGLGSALIVDAPSVNISRLTIFNWGDEQYDRDAGIQVNTGADNVTIFANDLSGPGHGIYAEQLGFLKVIDNKIRGNPQLHPLDRGDGIRLIRVEAPLLRGNSIEYVRDGIYLESSSASVIASNTFRQQQYGIHYMYTHHDEAFDNTAEAVDGGYALMSSSQIFLHHNKVTDGNSFGVLLNLSKSCTITSNQIHNVTRSDKASGELGKGMFIYSAQNNELVGNRITNNDIGISMALGGENNRVYLNQIITNKNQVKYVGNRQVEWSYQGQGNYWSHYLGADYDADGIGDIEYRPSGYLDRLFWMYPEVTFLMASPMVMLLRWLSEQFGIKEEQGVVDSFPLVQPLKLDAQKG
jgi:nitrous oxidase accessory protein